MICLTSVVDGKTIPIALKDVLYILYSQWRVIKLDERGLKVVFSSGTVIIEQSTMTVAFERQIVKLYKLALHERGMCRVPEYPEGVFEGGSGEDPTTA